jgi:hypothetical protein
MRWFLLALLVLVVTLILDGLGVPGVGLIAVIALLVVVAALPPFAGWWN